MSRLKVPMINYQLLSRTGNFLIVRMIHLIVHLMSYWRRSPNLQRGPPDSPFAGGEYHGVLLFPSEYPFKPPGIKVYIMLSSFQCFSGLIGKSRCSPRVDASNQTSGYVSRCQIFILDRCAHCAHDNDLIMINPFFTVEPRLERCDDVRLLWMCWDAQLTSYQIDRSSLVHAFRWDDNWLSDLFRRPQAGFRSA